jgi:hypothetical protein
MPIEQSTGWPVEVIRHRAQISIFGNLAIAWNFRL